MMFPFTGERNSSKNSGPPRMHPKDLKRLQRRISQGKNPPSVDLNEIKTTSYPQPLFVFDDIISISAPNLFSSERAASPWML